MEGEAILVTGATSFLAAHLIPKLLEQRCHIIAVKRQGSSVPEHLNNDVIEWVDVKDSVEVVKQRKALTIIHLATNYGHGGTVDEVIRSNVEWPTELLNAQISKGYMRFINTDSFFAKEQFSYGHMNDYIDSKRTFLAVAKKLAEANPSARVVSMRLEHIFGEYDKPQKFIPMIINKMLFEKSEIALTDGSQKRDFIYAGDVAEAYITVLQNFHSLEQCFTEFEVGSGQAVSLKELLVMMADITTVDLNRLRFSRLPQRENEIMHSVADNEPLRNLGWNPRVGLKAAVSRTVNYFK